MGIDKKDFEIPIVTFSLVPISSDLQLTKERLPTKSAVMTRRALGQTAPSLSRFTINLNGSAVAFDNSIRNGQPQTRSYPLLLCGKIGVKDTFQDTFHH